MNNRLITINRDRTTLQTINSLNWIFLPYFWLESVTNFFQKSFPFKNWGEGVKNGLSNINLICLLIEQQLGNKKPWRPNNDQLNLYLSISSRLQIFYPHPPSSRLPIFTLTYFINLSSSLFPFPILSLANFPHIFHVIIHFLFVVFHFLASNNFSSLHNCSFCLRPKASLRWSN